MLLRLSMVVSLLLLAFTTACTQAPPPDTHDADVQSLKDTDAAWAKVVAAKDFEKTVSYYADDASLLMSNAPAANGKDAIRAALKPVFDDPNFSLAFQPSRVEVAKSGDLGYTARHLHHDHDGPENEKTRHRQGQVPDGL